MKQMFEYINNVTEANCFYDRSRRCYCALWLGNGSEHRMYFNRGVNVYELCERILSKQLD